jgi:hypothetical protein
MRSTSLTGRGMRSTIVSYRYQVDELNAKLVQSTTVELEKYLIMTMKRLQSATVLRHVPPRFDHSRLESPTPARLRTRHAGSETAAAV